MFYTSFDFIHLALASYVTRFGDEVTNLCVWSIGAFNFNGVYNYDLDAAGASVSRIIIVASTRQLVPVRVASTSL